MGSNLPVVRIGDRDLDVVQMLSSKVGHVSEMMPEASGMTGAQLCRIAHMEVIRNPDLAKCNPLTIMNSVYDSARLGLLIGREAHLVPFKERCQMIPDFRGYLKLVYGSGLVTMIDAKIVFPEDDFMVREGTEMLIRHVPDYDIDREQGEKLLYVYAVAWLAGSPNPVFHVMNKAAVDKLRASSAMKNGDPWKKWYDRMALKSVLKYLCDKRLPATKVRGLPDLLELDNRAEVGKITSATSWEDKDDVEAQIDQRTAESTEDLRAALEDAQAKRDEGDEQPPMREPGDESENE